MISDSLATLWDFLGNPSINTIVAIAGAVITLITLTYPFIANYLEAKANDKK